MNQVLNMKYRGKRRDNGEWVEGYLFDDGMVNMEHYFIGSLVIEPYKGTADDDWDITGTYFYEVDPETICQSTGKYDKNHKEIYTNDIVKTKYGRLCIIKWFSASGYCGFDFYPIECDNPYPDKYDLWYSQNLEVVGNVFDNPELLKM